MGSASPIDTLIIVGNGFDLWQGLRTGYSEFQQFYLAHRDEIMRKLHIGMRAYIGEDGGTVRISDVELIYGDPFSPQELDDEFWGSFEASLRDIDAERINLFFGKGRRGLREMKKSIRNAKRILTEAFCTWISTIVISPKDADYRFGDNCFFINFNYTDTLFKCVGVDEGSVYHVHGEAADRKSIIFGHSEHPWLPEEALLQLGDRFKGLYLIESLLYETDKHVEDNIQMLCMYLALHGVASEQIRHVYVLGHSMSATDLAYFAFLSEATGNLEGSCPTDDEILEEYDDLEEFHNRLQFIIESIGYHRDIAQIDPAYRAAIERKYAIEQAARSASMQHRYLRMLQKPKRRRAHKSAPEKAAIPVRTEAAMWHITYHGEGKADIERAAQSLNLRNYRLYPSIDDCLIAFRTKDGSSPSER